MNHTTRLLFRSVLTILLLVIACAISLLTKDPPPADSTVSVQSPSKLDREPRGKLER